MPKFKNVICTTSDLFCFITGLSFSSDGGSQIYKMLVSIKLQPLISGTKILCPQPLIHLTPKQAKIVLKLVFLNKINILSVVILWLPTFWSSKILWPPYFSFQKFTPPAYLGPTLPKKMIAPLALTASHYFWQILSISLPTDFFFFFFWHDNLLLHKDSPFVLKCAVTKFPVYFESASLVRAEPEFQTERVLLMRKIWSIDHVTSNSL